jgi:hypothetical protein
MLAQEFDRFLVAIVAPRLRNVALHWQAVCGHDAIPAWHDIEPAAIAPELPIIWSWKYDHVADRFIGRLAGEAMNAIFGRSQRGKLLEEFFHGDAYHRMFARYKRVVTEPALYHGMGSVFHHEGRTGLGERIILPLARDGRTGDGLLGATVYAFPAPSDVWRTPELPVKELESFFPISAPHPS